MAEKRKCLAVVRVRGVGEASPDIRKTLEIFRLNRNCHMTLLDNRPSFLGMLKKARNFVTWGEITKETILLLLKERGRLDGNKKLNDEYAKKVGYKTLKELAEAIYKMETEFRHLPDIKPVFRAHPPKKGYKGKVKKSYAAGGVTGYRGEAINKLIENMI
ncbi:MAG: 50S ribosomal protein L30 [Candidatus Bathyarchaeota archaeon]|nr:50S ribosomal protein L30 [Candidatus Bathyarchaeota archaeon]MDH5494697.1 50S ribosomal protein L30 [Candidatus Bathyarchaeota archaeon]